MSKERSGTPGMDVFDLPDEDRETLHDDYTGRDTFQSVGIDDYTSVDTVLANNGERYFVTRL